MGPPDSPVLDSENLQCSPKLSEEPTTPRGQSIPDPLLFPPATPRKPKALKRWTDDQQVDSAFPAHLFFGLSYFMTRAGRDLSRPAKRSLTEQLEATTTTETQRRTTRFITNRPQAAQNTVSAPDMSDGCLRNSQRLCLCGEQTADAANSLDCNRPQSPSHESHSEYCSCCFCQSTWINPFPHLKLRIRTPEQSPSHMGSGKKRGLDEIDDRDHKLARNEDTDFMFEKGDEASGVSPPLPGTPPFLLPGTNVLVETDRERSPPMTAPGSILQ